jgi:hypothetical protein
MSAFAVRIALVATSIGLQSVLAKADSAPTLDTGESCGAAAQAGLVIGRDKEACLSDERAAQDTLKKGWSGFSSGDKTQCVGLVRNGGPPSYVELLSCLEVMQNSKTMRAADALAGQSTPVGSESTTPFEPKGSAGGAFPSVLRNGEQPPHLSWQRCWSGRCR